jgi:hypothetical protein
MIIKFLNKIGLYTAKQIRTEKLYVEAIDARLRVYMHKCKSLEEENKSLKNEIGDLKLKIAKSVKRRKR